MIEPHLVEIPLTTQRILQHPLQKVLLIPQHCISDPRLPCQYLQRPLCKRAELKGAEDGGGEAGEEAGVGDGPGVELIGGGAVESVEEGFKRDGVWRCGDPLELGDEGRHGEG